jgi:hypothetical protein
MGMQTVDSVVARYGEAARSHLAPLFGSAGIAYPPAGLALLVFKEERRLEVWGRSGDRWTHVLDYPILGASGVAGPKLREGDLQVPEGIYRLIAFNPNSAFHLSIKVDYPNAFDRQMGELDGRTELGGDIFIHGGSASIGCVALGDPAIEQLFVLVADIGLENVEVVIAPRDFRASPPRAEAGSEPAWLGELYDTIDHALEPFVGIDDRLP